MLLSYSTGSNVDYSLANKVSTTGDVSISGILDVSKVLNLQRHPTESDTIPLVIVYTSSSGACFVGKLLSTVKGCLFEYLTGASSTSWWQSILGGSSEFVVKTGSNGLTIQPNGNTTTSGNLDVGSGSSSRIRSHAANNGYTGYAELRKCCQWLGYVDKSGNDIS